VESTQVDYERYRDFWLEGISLDDQLFQQAIVTLRCLNLVHRGGNFPGQEERVLFQLIQRGVVDHDRSDRPWDASTRATRHSAAIGDRLWALILEERARVRVASILSWLGGLTLS
jgi:hypothetical protein